MKISRRQPCRAQVEPVLVSAHNHSLETAPYLDLFPRAVVPPDRNKFQPSSSTLLQGGRRGSPCCCFIFVVIARGGGGGAPLIATTTSGRCGSLATRPAALVLPPGGGVPAAPPRRLPACCQGRRAAALCGWALRLPLCHLAPPSGPHEGLLSEPLPELFPQCCLHTDGRGRGVRRKRQGGQTEEAGESDQSGSPGAACSRRPRGRGGWAIRAACAQSCSPRPA